MALEETGVKLVVQGEAAFNSAMQRGMALSVAFGQAIYNSAVAAGKAMVDFAGDSIKAASDLNETVSKAGIVFGSMAGKVIDFGSKAANAIGMSKNEAVGAAAGYGTLFRAMGLTEGVSADMSLALVQLAGDMASFNNISTEDALEKLRAGLVGETEPLRAVGVMLSADEVKAYAFAHGIAKTGTELTSAQKALATYGLIMDQTKLQQGDYARTFDGLANQQRTFTKNVENMKAALGTALLPIINKVMGVLNKMFNSTGFQKGMESVLTGISKLSDFFGVLLDDLISGDIGLAFDDFREGLYGLFPPEMEGMITTFNQALGTVWETVEKIGVFIGGVVTYIQEQGLTTFGDFFYALANGFMSISDGTGILQQIGDALFVVGDIVNQVMTWIEITISDALEKIQYWWVDNGEAITATVTTMWNGISNMFSSAVQFISTLISWLVTNIQTFWKNHGEAIMQIVSDLWVWITNAFNVATGVISSLFQAFTALLQGNWQGFIDKLLEAWDMLWGFIKQAAEAAWANLSTWFQGVIAAILNFFNTTDWGAIGRGIIDGIWNALQAGWGWLVEQIKGLAQQLFDAAMDFLNQHRGGGTGGITYPGMNGPQGAQSFGATQSVQGMLGGMASMAAGPVTNTYNYANNYNLNLTTTQTTQSVRTSFAIMQMLAG